MNRYCANCGRPVDETASYCSNCGARATSQAPVPPAAPAPAAPIGRHAPEVESILSLNNIAGILALIFAILLLIIGAITLIFIIGVFFIIFGVVNLLIWNKLKEINSLVNQGVYQRAKEEQITWAILGLLLGGIVIGIILLISYLKYDEVIRYQP
jgi:amino acid transporter